MKPIKVILGKAMKFLCLAHDLFSKQDIFGVDGKSSTEGKFYKGEIVRHPIYGSGYVVEEAPITFKRGEEPYLCKIQFGSDHSYGPAARVIAIYPGEGLKHTDRIRRKRGVTKEDLYPASYPYR